MESGQHVNYNAKTGEVFCTKKGGVDKYIAWKEGKMLLEDTPVAQIAKELPLWLWSTTGEKLPGGTFLKQKIMFEKK